MYVDQNQGTPDVIESLNEIQTTEKSEKGKEISISGNRYLHQAISIYQNIYSWFLFSCVTPDRVWASNWKDLILTSIQGDTLHYLKDSCCHQDTGRHTVNGWE